MCVHSFSLSVFVLARASPSGSYALSLHDALPILFRGGALEHRDRRLDDLRPDAVSPNDSDWVGVHSPTVRQSDGPTRSEEHTSELQSRLHLVCRLLLEKKN